jgi:predicted hydrolase (HD superfamily)
MADAEKPEEVAAGIVVQHDNDWETFDGRSEDRGLWTEPMLDLTGVIAKAIRAEREASDRRINEAVDTALERAIAVANAWDAKGGEPVARQIAYDIRRLLLKSPANPETV